MSDFSSIIRSLERSGMTQQQIAQKTGCTQANINYLKNRGQQPRFDLGIRIIRLAQDNNKT